MYALYKPCDRNKAFVHDSDELPNFARVFF